MLKCLFFEERQWYGVISINERSIMSTLGACLRMLRMRNKKY